MVAADARRTTDAAAAATTLEVGEDPPGIGTGDPQWQPQWPGGGFWVGRQTSPFRMTYVQGGEPLNFRGVFWHIGRGWDSSCIPERVLGKISAPKIHGNLCGVGFCWFYQIFGTGFCWQFGTWHSTCTVFSARTLQIDGRPIQGSELRSSYAIFEQEDC